MSKENSIQLNASKLKLDREQLEKITAELNKFGSVSTYKQRLEIAKELNCTALSVHRVAAHLQKEKSWNRK